MTNTLNTTNNIGNLNMKLFIKDDKYKNLEVKRGYVYIEPSRVPLYLEGFDTETEVIIYKYISGNTFNGFVYNETTGKWTETQIEFKPFYWIIDKIKRMLNFNNYDVKALNSQTYIGQSFMDHDFTDYVSTKYPGVFIKLTNDGKQTITSITKDKFKEIFAKHTDAWLTPSVYNVELELYMLLLTKER